MLLPIWLEIAGAVLALYIRDPLQSHRILSLLLVILGLILFIASKIRKIREDKLTSFGVKELNSREIKLYYLGYFLMIVGISFEVFLVTAR